MRCKRKIEILVDAIEVEIGALKHLPTAYPRYSRIARLQNALRMTGESKEEEEV